jgi:hypothetical protein
VIQYKVLSEHPCKYNEEKLSHEVHVVRRGRPDLDRSCYTIRRNLLAKRYGWGIHVNKQGKLKLVGCETKEYERLASETPNVVRVSRNQA